MTTDPFARRQPVNNNPAYSLGEVSTVENKQEEESARLAGYVPTEAETNEGYAKMLQILRQQEIDDAREGKKPRMGDPMQASSDADRIPQQPAGTTVTAPEFTQPRATQQYNNSYKDAVTTEYTAPFANNVSNTTTFTSGNSNDTVANHSTQPILTNVPKEEEKEPVESKKQEVKDEDVLPMLDSILLRGYASETFHIRGNRVTIRSQFYWEEYYIRDAVEHRLTENSIRLTADNLLQKYVLAASLEAFGGNYFKPIAQGSPTTLQKSLQERVDFLETLPTILVSYLDSKRVEFNTKLLYLSDNFDRLVKSF